MRFIASRSIWAMVLEGRVSFFKQTYSAAGGRLVVCVGFLSIFRSVSQKTHSAFWDTAILQRLISALFRRRFSSGLARFRKPDGYWLRLTFHWLMSLPRRVLALIVGWNRLFYFFLPFFTVLGHGYTSLVDS
jgi:hypothetical protein